MKRFSINIFTLAAIISCLMIALPPYAAGADKPENVNVVNTPSVNVKTMPSVTVNGPVSVQAPNPLPVSISGNPSVNANITNSSLPVTIQNSAANEIQDYFSCRADLGIGSDFGSCTIGPSDTNFRARSISLICHGYPPDFQSFASIYVNQASNPVFVATIPIPPAFTTPDEILTMAFTPIDFTVKPTGGWTVTTYFQIYSSHMSTTTGVRCSLYVTGVRWP